MAGRDARPTHDSVQTGIVFSDGLIQIITNPCRYIRRIMPAVEYHNQHPRRAGILARRAIQTCEAEWRAVMPALRIEFSAPQICFSDYLQKKCR
ncbi:hypothetical protein HMPREF9370_0381 [Neisseria wadsworthii 9715]|uniref:Uncharacterized protein n=1 Tax=Neisseria wadsworthii 9715 TaxID=1030841 RepID=G4CMS2_9NEIS|nr:hypothetical protein HMPREF9370_0381 [Neisseria wadsworthii 9715]